MYQWNICRTCLSIQNLHPIFMMPEHSEKYSSAIYETTGVKIEISDSLPQEICSVCINFINKCIKFRRKCEDAQKRLLESKHNVKIESSDICVENETSIDISSFLDDENDFKDYDDNITLDAFQLHEIPNQIDENKQTTELNNKVDLTKLDYNAKKSFKKRVIKKKEGEKREKVNRERIECEFCHKILTSKLSLRNHYKIHTGFDVVCEHCGKKFITRRLLLMHCRAKHGYEKTDKCSFCDYRASNAEQVKIHERLHTGEKPFVCSECSAGFHRKSSYLQHVAIHLPEKTVQCDQCPARFKSVTLMRIHKNRHRAPQYTFKCGVCDNSFARRRNVARHLQRVHGLAPDAHIQRLKIH